MSKCADCQKMIFVPDKKSSTKNMKQERCKCSPSLTHNADSKTFPPYFTTIANVEDTTQLDPRSKKRTLPQQPTLLSSTHPELWVGLTVRVQKSASNKGECETGVVLRSGNGWVQLKTDNGVIAKRAFNLEIVGNSSRSEPESAHYESSESKIMRKRAYMSSDKEVTEETMESTDQTPPRTVAVKAEPIDCHSAMPSSVPTPWHSSGKANQARNKRKSQLDDERPPVAPTLSAGTAVLPPVLDIQTARTRTQNSRSGSQYTNTTITVLTEASLADKDKAHSTRTRRERERSGSFAESETAISVTASATVVSASPAPASVSSQDTPTSSHIRPVNGSGKTVPSRRTAVTSRRGAHLPSRTSGVKPTALSSSHDRASYISTKPRRSQPVVTNERVSANTNGTANSVGTCAATSNSTTSGLNGFQHISNGPRINALLCEVRRNIVQKFVERHRDKIKDRPDLKEWAIRINAQFVDADHERTTARRPLPDLVCDYCGTEKWPDSAFCWNECCAGSSIYTSPSDGLGRSRDSEGSLVNDSLINGSISFSMDSFMYRTASMDSVCVIGNDVPLHDSPRFNTSSVPISTGFVASAASSEDMELACMSPRRRLKRVLSQDKSDRDRVKSPTTPGQGLLRRRGSFSFASAMDTQVLPSLSSENILAMGKDTVSLPVIPAGSIPAVSDYLIRASSRLLDQSPGTMGTVQLSVEQLEEECGYLKGLSHEDKCNINTFYADYAVESGVMGSNSFSPPNSSDSSSSSAAIATTVETRTSFITLKSHSSSLSSTSSWNQMESFPLPVDGIRQS